MKFMLAASKPNFAESAHTTQRFNKPRLEGKYGERNIIQESFDYTAHVRCTMRTLKKIPSVTQSLKVNYKCVTCILIF